MKFGILAMSLIALAAGIRLLTAVPPVSGVLEILIYNAIGVILFGLGIAGTIKGVTD